MSEIEPKEAMKPEECDVVLMVTAKEAQTLGRQLSAMADDFRRKYDPDQEDLVAGKVYAAALRFHDPSDGRTVALFIVSSVEAWEAHMEHYEKRKPTG